MLHIVKIGAYPDNVECQGVLLHGVFLLNVFTDDISRTTYLSLSEKSGPFLKQELCGCMGHLVGGKVCPGGREGGAEWGRGRGREREYE